MPTSRFAFWVLLLSSFAPLVSAAPITPDNFELANDYSRVHNGVGLRVEQDGRLCFESYAPGDSAGTAHRIYSGTKNFVAVAALYAEQEALLDLDELASKTLPEWRHDRRSTITLNQLLSQTSGLAPGTAIIQSCRDQMAGALRVHLIDPPGSRFHYGPVGYQAFGEILKRKLRPSGRTVEGYLRSHIFKPLGISTPYWKHDDAGNPLMHAGLGLTARDWAKFGEFVLGEMENRKKQTIDPELFKILFTEHEANPAYGLSFWVNRPPPSPRLQKMTDLQPAIDGDQLDPGGPSDVYAALGTGGQRLYIIPSKSLVIVRFSNGGAFSDGDFLSRLLTGIANPDRHTH